MSICAEERRTELRAHAGIDPLKLVLDNVELSADCGEGYGG